MTRFLPEAYEDLVRLDEFHIQTAGKPPFPSEVVLERAELLDSFPFLGAVHSDPFLAGRGFRRLFAGRWAMVYRVDGNHADENKDGQNADPHSGEACVYRVFHQRAAPSPA